MKRYLPFFFLTLTACTTLETVKAPVDPILTKIEGTWGTVDPTSLSCDKAPQIFTVSKDRTMVTVRSANKLYLGGDDGLEAIAYRVLAVHGNVLTMFIEGEDRKTENGDPVVWSLVLTSEREFYWRQTDWRKGAGTRPFMRCG
jgi:hypothetical protein